MKIKISKEWIDRLIWLLTVVFLTLICITATLSYGKYILVGFSMVVFLLAAIANEGKVRLSFGCFHGFYLVFALYCFLSALWAWNFGAAVSQGRTILEILICLSLFYIYYQEKSDLWGLYSAVKWSGFAACCYTIYDVGLNNVVSLLTTGKRLVTDFGNVNTVGILASFAILITLYEVFFRKLNIISVIFCIPSLAVMAASGTRKALLALIVGVIMLIYFRFRDRNILKSVLKFAAIGAVAVLSLSLILSLPMFSGMMDRMGGMLSFLTGESEADASSLVRSRFIEIGLEQFSQTPIFGIGIGSSGDLLLREFGESTYLHNNFVELLCCGGVVGFLLYYAMYAYCIFGFWKYRRSGDSLSILGVIMLVLMLLMDVARVSYYSKPTIFYFMIFFLHIRNLKQQERGSL